MLTSLHVENFEKHSSYTIEFEPITTLIGPSRHGKSSLLRALRWVFWNQPDGMRFIRHGKEEVGCTVTAVVDGHTLTRQRAKKENRYELDGQEYKAFGRGVVPEPIQNLLNLHDCTWWQQISLPFWLMDQPSEVTANLNSIINLSLMDEAVNASASVLRETNGDLKRAEEQLRDVSERKQGLKWVLRCEAKLQQLEELKTQEQEAEQRCSHLQNLLIKLENLRLPQQRKYWQQLEKLQTYAARVQSLNLDISRLQTIFGQWDTLQAILQQPVPNISELILVREQGDKISEERRHLELLLNEITENKKQLLKDKQAYDSLLQEVPERCPTCQQPITKDHWQSLSPTSTCPTKPPLPARTVTGIKRKNTT